MEKEIEKLTGKKGSLDWERDLVQKLAFAAIDEQRRYRRWSFIFKFLILVYLVAVLLLYAPIDWDSSAIQNKAHTALIDIDGVIMAKNGVSADDVVASLRKAFKDEQSKGIILRINSPGGSPVQTRYVYNEVNRLREKYKDRNIKVYAVIVDICASGGYYIASVADEIYADQASMIGSIGVLMDNFGFVETMKILGVERRLITAGEHKGLLDPFSPVDDGEVAHMKTLLADIHQQFINDVKKGRGERLKDDPSLFTGLVWSGQQSLDLGLIDGFGSSSYVAREIIGEENIVDYSPSTDLLERFAEKIGATTAQSLVEILGLDRLKLH